MSSFSELINGDKPVLVDFHATWCGPCKAMEPALLQVAKEIHEKVTVLKVDIDKNPDAARSYQVQGVPTLVLFKKGEIVWRKSGAMDANTIKSFLQPFIN